MNINNQPIIKTGKHTFIRRRLFKRGASWPKYWTGIFETHGDKTFYQLRDPEAPLPQPWDAMCRADTVTHATWENAKVLRQKAERQKAKRTKILKLRRVK